MLNKKDIYIFLTTSRKEGGLQFFNEKEFSKKFPEIYSSVNVAGFPKEFTFKQKLYHWLHNDFELNLGICAECGNRCKFINFKKGYAEFCSSVCMRNSQKVKDRRSMTNLERHGSKHYNNRNKAKQTCMKKYGVEYAVQADPVKAKSRNTKKERYGDERYTNREKCWSTCEEKYSEKYLFKTEIFKTKSRNTKKDRYGDERYTNREKCWNTCKEKHSVLNPFQIDSVKQKIKETNKEKYNVEYATQSEYIKEKIKNSLYEHYGYEYALQSPEIIEKLKHTNMERYGVPYACMRSEARCHSNNSKPNKEFAKLLDENNIVYEREFHLGNYSYDFRVENILIEVNPTVTHNAFMNVFGNEPLDMYYHFNKSYVAYENGFICIHVWDWTDKQQTIQHIEKYDIASINEPRLHWHNMKTKYHMTDTYSNYAEMIMNGFLPVYDDGFELVSYSD